VNVRVNQARTALRRDVGSPGGKRSVSDTSGLVVRLV
jgi:hypothetical protein